MTDKGPKSVGDERNGRSSSGKNAAKSQTNNSNSSGSKSGPKSSVGKSANGPAQNKKSTKRKSGGKTSGFKRRGKPGPRYAALDLGTNNCRLLIAAPRGRDYRIVDAYSRIVRLGENLTGTGRLSEAAMERTINVLAICAEKIQRRGVTRMRLIATQACRGAENGEAFLQRVKEETGLTLEIIDPEEEARLAMRGCTDLFDPAAKAVLVFDIGGGSTEISWVRPVPGNGGTAEDQSHEIMAWSSLPFGVVSLAEKWNGRDVSRAVYDEIVANVRQTVREVGDEGGMRPFFDEGSAHLLGTSGTVTSIAGVHLKLDRYRRTDVDGLWLSKERIAAVSEDLRAMDFDQRAAEPCIGAERADLVVCGCAILEAILAEWPVERVRVADRGLREGMLMELAEQDRRKKSR